jgi:hypothetical protein
MRELLTSDLMELADLADHDRQVEGRTPGWIAMHPFWKK